MKRVRPLQLYRALPAAQPDAATDAYILAAARSARTRARRMPLAAALLAAVMSIALVARWLAPGQAPEIDTRQFAIAEGQAQVYLATFDIKRPTGPGSREGTP